MLHAWISSVNAARLLQDGTVGMEFSSRKDVANFPLLSLLHFFFPRDGDTRNFNKLQNY